jgi:hypothetical protein
MQVRLTFFYPPQYLFGGGKTGITITGVPFVTIGLPSRSVIWFLIDTPAPRLSDESISSISCSSFPGYTVLSMTAGGYSSRSLFGSVCTFAIRLLLRRYAPGQSITPPRTNPLIDCLLCMLGCFWILFAIDHNYCDCLFGGGCTVRIWDCSGEYSPGWKSHFDRWLLWVRWQETGDSPRAIGLRPSANGSKPHFTGQRGVAGQIQAQTQNPGELG